MTDKTLKAAPRRACDTIAPANAVVAASIKALHTGTATPHQQQTALQWIIREAGGKAYFPYHADPHDTAFALGRLFAAEAVLGLVNADLSAVRGTKA